jgi:hypothetical protein
MMGLKGSRVKAESGAKSYFAPDRGQMPDDRWQMTDGRGQMAVKTVNCGFSLVPKMLEKDFLY